MKHWNMETKHWNSETAIFFILICFQILKQEKSLWMIQVWRCSWVTKVGSLSFIPAIMNTLKTGWQVHVYLPRLNAQQSKISKEFQWKGLFKRSGSMQHLLRTAKRFRKVFWFCSWRIFQAQLRCAYYKMLCLLAGQSFHATIVTCHGCCVAGL